jgi:hypothetical protein
MLARNRQAVKVRRKTFITATQISNAYMRRSKETSAKMVKTRRFLCVLTENCGDDRLPPASDR